MENLEKIVKAEEKHFPIKILLGAATVLTLGLYHGNAHAGNVVIQTDKGAVTGFTRGNQVFDSNGRSVGVVVNGTAVPNSSNSPIRPGAGNMRSYEGQQQGNDDSYNNSNNNSNVCFRNLIVESPTLGLDVFVDGSRVGKTNFSGRIRCGNTYRITVKGDKTNISKEFYLSDHGDEILKLRVDPKNKVFRMLQEIDVENQNGVIGVMESLRGHWGQACINGISC